MFCLIGALTRTRTANLLITNLVVWQYIFLLTRILKDSRVPRQMKSSGHDRGTTTESKRFQNTNKLNDFLFYYARKTDSNK